MIALILRDGLYLVVADKASEIMYGGNALAMRLALEGLCMLTDSPFLMEESKSSKVALLKENIQEVTKNPDMDSEVKNFLTNLSPLIIDLVSQKQIDYYKKLLSVIP